MPDMYLETPSQIKGDPAPLKKKKKWVRVVVDIFLVVFFLGCIAVSGNVIYLSVAYNESFFVNGMSMYPTLNGSGMRLDNGSYRPLTWQDGENRNGDIVDYGYSYVGDKNNWKENLARYDVVICYYADDIETNAMGYVYNEDGTPSIKKNAYPKVKRIVGLPKEHVLFSATTETDEYQNPAWGKTVIGQFDESGVETTFPVRPLYSQEDYPSIKTGVHSYSYPAASAGTYNNLLLGEDEYYVLGDNRGGAYSSDSRRKGPIKSSWIIGKAMLVTAKRKLVERNGDYGVEFDLGGMRMPWDYLDLSVHPTGE